ncbi:MBL fold metallo-hydrolase [Ideonella sp. A 288]|uniref:MBL fold metallo-hydrolase n=1 Tax=Ideonella sp. A 288 TaxID=1962181 RepID=UPI001F457DCB|nr:MBL fold metallo-hydrolase [Ideonella sp. A 288]
MSIACFPAIARAWRLGWLLLALGMPWAVAQAQPAALSTVRMEAVEVAAGTYVVQGEAALGSPANLNFISNASFVVADGGVLVIDALGSPPLAQRLLELIGRITPLPVRYVVVTHCHADHIYGLQVMKAAGASVVGHVGCREYLHSDTARLRMQASREQLYPAVDEHTRLVPPDLWLGEGGDNADLMLRIGQRSFRVRHAGPSHTPEDLVVHDAVTGALFAGDIVFRGRVPFVGQADSRRWIVALDRLLELKPTLLVPGHGPVSRQPADDLGSTRDYLAYLRKTMGEAAARMEPFDEAYARTDWSRFAGLPMFGATHRMNAYNTYLLMEHEKP